MFDAREHAIKDTNAKFNSKLEPIPYYGTTIISYLNTDKYPIFRPAEWAQKELMQCSFAKSKLAFLPSDSFHMTIESLCREVDRGGPTWPPMIPADARFPEIDAILKEIVDAIPFPEHITVEVDCCEVTRIVLKPHTAEDVEKLKRYRDQVADKTGIHHPWHDGFRFHITLDYKVFDLEEKELVERDAVCARLTEELKKQVKPFEISKAQFVIFNDMMSYYPDVSKRGPLY